MPTPVVLVHDLGSSASALQGVAEALAPRTVIAPDLPGHGTRTGEPVTFEAVTDSIAAACLEASESPILVGFGAGAHLAIAAAGASASAVIAVGCGTEPLSWSLDSYRTASMALLLLPDQGAAVNDATSQSFGAASSMREILERLARIDIRDGLRQIDSPVTLINGSRDRFRMQERALLRAARHSTLVRVPGLATAASEATIRAIAAAAQTR